MTFGMPDIIYSGTTFSGDWVVVALQLQYTLYKTVCNTRTSSGSIVSSCSTAVVKFELWGETATESNECTDTA